MQAFLVALNNCPLLYKPIIFKCEKLIFQYNREKEKQIWNLNLLSSCNNQYKKYMNVLFELR